jgi:predicted RNA polymerase sigma factor
VQGLLSLGYRLSEVQHYTLRQADFLLQAGMAGERRRAADFAIAVRMRNAEEKKFEQYIVKLLREDDG